MIRAMQSDYMHWAKFKPPVRYALTSSEVPHFRMDSLGLSLADLDMDGASHPRYAPLRERIAKRYGVAIEQVVAGDGTSMANFLAMATLIEPGDEVLIEHPTYSLLLEAASFLGAEIKRFERKASDAFRLDPAMVEAAMSDRTKLIILTNLHNPSGALAEEAELRAIGRLGARVLVDEVYLDAASRRSAVQFGPAPGDIRFVDNKKDGAIDQNDRVYLGSFLPNYSYGLNFNANYKGIDFVMFFQGVQGNKVYNGTKVIEQGMLRLFNSSTDVLRAWTPTNTNTDVPRAISGDPNNNARTSDRFVENGSYLRLKNVSIGYSIPEAAVQRMTKNSLTKLRIYATATNLLTFTKYTGYDPEVGIRPGQPSNLIQGVDYGQFPQARTFMVGIQAGF